MNDERLPNEISGPAEEWNDGQRAIVHGDAAPPIYGSVAPPPNVSGMPMQQGSITGMAAPPQDAPGPVTSTDQMTQALMAQLAVHANAWIKAYGETDQAGMQQAKDRIEAWDQRYYETFGQPYNWARIMAEVIVPNTHEGVPFPVPHADEQPIQATAERQFTDVRTETEGQTPVADFVQDTPVVAQTTQIAASEHEVSEVGKIPEKKKLQEDPDIYFVAGNVVQQQAMTIMQVPAAQRPQWWDATFIPQIAGGITMVRFIRGESPITVEHLFTEGMNFLKLDYEAQTHKAFTLDDLHFMDQTFGTME
jgi:hypothetical protein